MLVLRVTYCMSVLYKFLIQKTTLMMENYFFTPTSYIDTLNYQFGQVCMKAEIIALDEEKIAFKLDLKQCYHLFLKTKINSLFEHAWLYFIFHFSKRRRKRNKIKYGIFLVSLKSSQTGLNSPSDVFWRIECNTKIINFVGDSVPRKS